MTSDTPTPDPQRPVAPPLTAALVHGAELAARAALKRGARRGTLGPLKKFLLAATALRGRLEVVELTSVIDEPSLFDTVAAPAPAQPPPAPDRAPTKKTRTAKPSKPSTRKDRECKQPSKA